MRPDDRLEVWRRCGTDAESADSIQPRFFLSFQFISSHARRFNQKANMVILPCFIPSFKESTGYSQKSVRELVYTLLRPT